MEIPSVVYPGQFNVDGYIFEVVAFCQLTHEQARNVVLRHCRTQKLKKKDKGKVCRIVTTLDENTARMYGA